MLGFADPQYQDIPEAWKNDDASGLIIRIVEHTRQVLGLLTENDIYPEWVQVGNEISPGILGFSYYPYWYHMMENQEALDLFYNPLIYYSQKYHKPVMVCEVGGPETEPEATCKLLCNTVEAIRQVPDNQGLGIFYWEPEIGAKLLPDQYPLGAAQLVAENTLQYTKALTAYRDSKSPL